MDIKCPGDVDGKCRCAVEFSVLNTALPQGIESLVRTVMHSMSRLFLSGDEEQLVQQANTDGSEQRNMLMRYKNCPKCGTMTTKYGCVGTAVYGGMDKCPNEA